MSDKERFITLRFQDDRILFPVAGLKAALWKLLPVWMREPESDEARAESLKRVAVKTALRTFGDDLLSGLFGKGNEPRREKRDDILRWFCVQAVHAIVERLAQQEWILNGETCEDCGGRVFQVSGLVAWAANGSLDRGAADATPEATRDGGSLDLDADPESVRNRTPENQSVG